MNNEGNKYLLLAEFSVRTVNYGPRFFPSIYGPSAKRAGHKSAEFFRETLLCYIFVFCHYHALIIVLQNKHTTLAENGENSISTKPRISAHFQGPKIEEAP